MMMPDMQMPDFQSEINRAKSIAATRGLGRLTFGWKEKDHARLGGARSGSVTVTSTSPSAFRVYERGGATPWLTEFDNDMQNGVFGTNGR
jgi:hypothetical protein